MMAEAEILQTRLKRFARSSHQLQTQELPDLLTVLMSVTTPQIMEGVANQSSLQTTSDGKSSIIESVMRSALQTQFRSKDKVYTPWEGATAVILNPDGELKAAFFIPEGKVYEQYNMTELYFGALRKALLSMYLYQGGITGGLENVKNLDFLAQLGQRGGFIAGTDLFRGEAQFPILGRTKIVEGRKVTETTLAFIGISGCTFQRPYLQTLERYTLPTNYDINLRAGLSERAFAERLGAHLIDPWETPRVIDEPGVIKHFRASN